MTDAILVQFRALSLRDQLARLDAQLARIETAAERLGSTLTTTAPLAEPAKLVPAEVIIDSLSQSAQIAVLETAPKPGKS